jgi:hypothetical protein
MNKMSDELRLVVVAAFLRRIIASRVRASEAEKHLQLDSLTPEDKARLKAVLQNCDWMALSQRPALGA